MRPDATPSDVVAEVYRRLEAEDYAGAAELYHDDMVAFSVATARSFARPPEASAPTVEGLMRLYPDMPIEAAEYQVRQAANRPPPSPYFEELAGVESASDLDALDARTVLARRLEGSDDRPRFRAYLDRLARENPEYADQLERQKRELRFAWDGARVLGSVEQLDRSYVVVGVSDERLAAYSDERPDDHLAHIVVLKRSVDGWRISCELGHGRGWISHLHVTVVTDSGERIVLS